MRVPPFVLAVAAAFAGVVVVVAWRAQLEPATRPVAPSRPAPESRVEPAPAPMAFDRAESEAAPAPVADGTEEARTARVNELGREIEAALAARGDDPSREETLAARITELIELDPSAASAWVQRWPPGTRRQELLRRVAQRWALADSVGALRWISGLADPAERRGATAAAAVEIARADPADAARAVVANGIGDDTGTFEQIAQSWAERDPAAARQWIETQAPGGVRAAMLARVASVQARSQPAAAAALVSEAMPPGPLQEATALEVLRQWVAQDRAAAEAWVRQFPAGRLREQAERELAATNSEPPAAAQ